jgi:TPR repeat protein
MQKLSAGTANPPNKVIRRFSNLGYMYYYGYGVPPDRVQAYDLFQQAAAHGNEDAKRALECYRKGISIDPGAGLRGLQ